MLRLGKEVRSLLIAEGIVRAPRGSGSAPVCWVQPVGGVPAPAEGPVAGEQSDPVVGLMTGVGVSPQAFEQKWLSRDALDVVIRASEAKIPEALDLNRKIRRALADRRGFNAGQLRIEESLETSPLGLITTDQTQGSIFRATYIFTVRDSSYGA